MKNFGATLAKIIPDSPRQRYTVFNGTNTWPEWWKAMGLLVGISKKKPGQAIRDFEALITRITGAQYAISFGAGRMGFYLALDALGLRPGDEIILPGFTCTVVPNALLYRGLKPVYADINPITFNIDPLQADAAITQRTRALYAQHTFGISCDIASLQHLAAKNGLMIIEDLAHSLGALFQGQPHGSLGDVSYFSTDRTKIINTIVGGVVTTSNAKIAGKLYDLQKKCMTLNRFNTRLILFDFLVEFIFRAPPIFWIGRPLLGALRRIGLEFRWQDETFDTLPAGYPYPCVLPAALAELGSIQLANLEDNLSHRRKLAKWLETRIEWYGNTIDDFDSQAWLRYSFLVRDRDEFIKRFSKLFDLGIWFPHVIFGRESDPGKVNYRLGTCPIAETVAKHIVNFPTHPRIPLAIYENIWQQHGGWLANQLHRIRC